MARENPMPQWRMMCEALRDLGGDEECIKLDRILKRVYRLYPETRDSSEDSLTASFNYHCINMRSRFTDPRNPRAADYWRSEPAVYRCDPGYYRLLSEEDLRLFRKAEGLQIDTVFEEEYPMGALRAVMKKRGLWP